MLLHACVINLSGRFAFKELFLTLSLQIIDVLVRCYTVLSMDISKLELMTETLTKL